MKISQNRLRLKTFQTNFVGLLTYVKLLICQNEGRRCLSEIFVVVEHAVDEVMLRSLAADQKHESRGVLWIPRFASNKALCKDPKFMKVKSWPVTLKKGINLEL